MQREESNSQPQDMCDFIRHPRLNGYSVSRVGAGRFALSAGQVLLPRVSEGQRERERVARRYVRVHVSTRGERAHVLCAN